MTSVARLKIEVRKSIYNKQENLKLGVDYHPRKLDDLYKWVIYLKFLDQYSPYYGQTYEVDVYIPQNYPFDHPHCKFVTRIFHPNIDTNGKICLNLINDDNCEWTAANTLYYLAIGLQSLVYCPNCDSPLNLDAGNIYRQDDTRAFKNMVRYYYTLNGTPAQ